jgi:hypothetical protein
LISTKLRKTNNIGKKNIDYFKKENAVLRKKLDGINIKRK